MPRRSAARFGVLAMFAKFAAASAVFASAVLFASTASATLIRDYELNGSLTDSAGSGIDITNNGATLGPSGLTFGANQGPTATGLDVSVYTIVTSFDLDTVDGYRKLVDFKVGTSDNGLYTLNGDLDFYNSAFGPGGVIGAGDTVQVALTRDGSGLVTGYVNGVQQFSFDDSSTQLAVTGANPQDKLLFFQDDVVTGQREASGGFVDYIKVYDTALSASDIAALNGGVPEPAAWAMMILGLGGAGAVLRRRRNHLALA